VLHTSHGLAEVWALDQIDLVARMRLPFDGPSAAASRLSHS